MPLEPFQLEVWLAQHQDRTQYDFSSTGMGAVSLEQLQSWGLALPSWETTRLGYGDLDGTLALRGLIAERYIHPRQILVTQGAIEANTLVMTALLNPGDQVITFTPGYQQLISWPKFLGAEVILWPLSTADQFDAQPLAPDGNWLATTPIPKMIVLNHPHNPTGKCFSAVWLQQLVTWASQHGVWILCDEVYRDLHPGGPNPLASLADMGYERIAVTGSFSKSLGLPGLRLGWINGPADLVRACRRIKDYLSISPATLSDALGVAVLSHWDQLWPLRYAQYCASRQWFLNQVTVPAVLQGGAMAWLPCGDPGGVAEQILQATGGLLVPGSCFGAYAALRVGFGTVDRPEYRACLQTAMALALR